MKKRCIAMFVIVIMLTSLTACANKEVRNISEKIKNISEITIESKKLLDEIEAEYSLLSDEDKAKVKNYDEYIKATKKYEVVACIDSVKSVFLKVAECVCSDYESYSDFEKRSLDVTKSALNKLEEYSESDFGDNDFKDVLKKCI